MKKTIATILAAVLLICLAGCGGGSKGDNSSGNPAEAGRLRIVATIFPEYDWAKNVLGENPAGAELALLQSNGTDMHSFQPSAGDILSISTCDLFIYVGGESDAWVKDALAQAVNKDMEVINLMEVLGDAAREEETVEGMQESEEGHDHGEEGHGGDEGPEYDEHVWLSLRNAAAFTESISQALQKADAANAETYRKNAASYTEKLNALDAQYKSAADGARHKTLLFGDRFPFRYLAEDYGLSYFAAFSGCSAETEASFETVAFLAKKMDELGLPAVMIIDGSDGRIADTVIRSTQKKDQKILTLNSMQSTAAKDIKDGVTYLSIMESNLAVLEEALK